MERNFKILHLDEQPWESFGGQTKDIFRKSLSPAKFPSGFKASLTLAKPGGEFPEHIDPYSHIFYILEGEGEGAAQLFIGSITKGRMGGGFLYTNHESLSLGLVIGIESLNSMEPREEIYKWLDEFKERPEIKNLVRGGETVEYSAHLLTEGGIHHMPKVFTDGMLVVGDAAGLGLNMLVTVRGMEYAIVSGVLAGRTIKKAKEMNDFSASSLSEYERLLKESFILQEMKNFQYVPSLLGNQRLFSKYPQLICDLFERVMWVDEEPKGRIYQTKIGELKKELFSWETFKDWLQFRKI